MEMSGSTVPSFIRRFWRGAQLELRMLGLVILLALALSLVSPHFSTPVNLYNLMDQTVTIGIASIGASLVILTGGIDLAVGSILGISAILLGISFGNWGIGAIGGIAVCLLTGTLAGSVSGFLVAKAGLAPFVATLGLMTIGRSQCYVMSNAKSISTLPRFVEELGNAEFLGIPINFLCLLSFYLVTWLFLNRTKTGRSIYAIGSNEEAARLAGIAVDRTKILCYSLSGFGAAVAGIFLAGRILSVDVVAGTGMEMDAIASVVIGGGSLSGGRGSIIGTFMGVLVLVLIRNGLNLMKVNAYWQGTAVGLVIVAALLVERLFRKGRD
ncbi:MAG: ABC transporter permease [Planctomycetota bacterium]|nr:ABC transporter permease [Planctomycetota bacterium]